MSFQSLSWDTIPNFHENKWILQMVNIDDIYIIVYMLSLIIIFCEINDSFVKNK